MNGRRNKALNEGTGPRGIPATTGAETVAIGTAAGALMLGVLQADAAPKDEVRSTTDAVLDPPQDGQVDDSGPAAPDAPAPAQPATLEQGVFARAATAHPPMAANQAAVAQVQASDAQGVDQQVGHADALQTHDGAPEGYSGADGGNTSGGDAVTSSSPIVHAVDADGLAGRIADQITAAIGQISQGINEGMASDAIGQSVASDIRTAVADIAKDIEASFADLNDFAGVAAAVPQLDGLVQSVESDLASAFGQVPDATEILSDAAGSLLSDVPSTILGAETADSGSSGLLSQLFYDDGQSDLASVAQSTALVLPGPVADVAADAGAASPSSDMLSEAAYVMDDSGAAHGIDFAGLSYIDTPDHGYEGMLSTPNALHVL